MKKSTLALALSLPAFALLSACGGTTNTTETVVVDNGAMADDPFAMDNDMAMAGETATTGQAFADTAAASDAYEIAAGNLAKEKATSQALKDFGAMMVTAHTESTAKLKDAAAKVTPAITPNPAMTVEQEANLATLRDATGADFDAAYKSQQVAAHAKTLAAMQGYAASGDVAELKAFASTTAPVVQDHLAKIEAM